MEVALNWFIYLTGTAVLWGGTVRRERAGTVCSLVFSSLRFSTLCSFLESPLEPSVSTGCAGMFSGEFSSLSCLEVYVLGVFRGGGCGGAVWALMPALCGPQGGRDPLQPGTGPRPSLRHGEPLPGLGLLPADGGPPQRRPLSASRRHHWHCQGGCRHRLRQQVAAQGCVRKNVCVLTCDTCVVSVNDL